MVRPCRITRWFGILVHLRPNECPTGTSHRDGERDDGTCDAVMVPGPGGLFLGPEPERGGDGCWLAIERALAET